MEEEFVSDLWFKARNEAIEESFRGKVSNSITCGFELGLIFFNGGVLFKLEKSSLGVDVGWWTESLFKGHCECIP